MKPVLSVLSRVFVFLLLYVFAVWVWPTPYYHLKTAPSSGVYDMRVNRFTGHAQKLTMHGWQDAQAESELLRTMGLPLPKRDFYPGSLVGLHR